jgi:hypothetical protein
MRSGKGQKPELHQVLHNPALSPHEAYSYSRLQ